MVMNIMMKRRVPKRCDDPGPAPGPRRAQTKASQRPGIPRKPTPAMLRGSQWFPIPLRQFEYPGPINNQRLW